MYRDYKSSFKELLQKDKSITIHPKNLQYLEIEIYKNIKSSESVDIFKSKIKKWVQKICLCRLCKTYVNQVGFVN